MVSSTQPEAGGNAVNSLNQYTLYDAEHLFFWIALTIAYALVFWLLYLLYGQRTPKQDIASLHHYIRYHFLFNALNTTVCLIESHPRRAKANLEKLSELFRVMLSQKEKISLQEEIETVRCYVDIEQIRLGDRLQVAWHLDCDDALASYVPTMLLQPLVENAIYHGMETLTTHAGTVDVIIRSSNRKVIFEVENPIGNQSHLQGHSSAQKNIEKRLALYYGKGQFQFIKSQNMGKYHILISFPKEKEGK